jgi:DNA replication protein DnaD
MDPEVIIDAIDRGVAQGIRKWAYIDGILKSHKAAGVVNMAGVAAEDEEWERRKSAQNTAGGGRGEREDPFLANAMRAVANAEQFVDS